mmetsp:Transcript_9389/g.14079  ORF Transcript_9389/g.14079 Transcript_9389/m.14079 type:complete len:205 (-) Transcript_9389:1186-1800(-)
MVNMIHLHPARRRKPKHNEENRRGKVKVDTFPTCYSQLKDAHKSKKLFMNAKLSKSKLKKRSLRGKKNLSRLPTRKSWQRGRRGQKKKKNEPNVRQKMMLLTRRVAVFCMGSAGMFLWVQVITRKMIQVLATWHIKMMHSTQPAAERKNQPIPINKAINVESILDNQRIRYHLGKELIPIISHAIHSHPKEKGIQKLLMKPSSH